LNKGKKGGKKRAKEMKRTLKKYRTNTHTNNFFFLNVFAVDLCIYQNLKK
jgi:hypothetical protein